MAYVHVTVMEQNEHGQYWETDQILSIPAHRIAAVAFWLGGHSASGRRWVTLRDACWLIQTPGAFFVRAAPYTCYPSREPDRLIWPFRQSVTLQRIAFAALSRVPANRLTERIAIATTPRDGF